MVPLAASCLLCTACGVASPRRIAALQSASIPAALQFDSVAPDGETVTPLGARFVASLSAALQKRGVAIDPGSPNHIAFGFSVRSAAIGLGPQSPPRKHRWFDTCHAQRAEVAVVLRDVQTGDVLGRWRGGFDDCQIEPAEVDLLADDLAAVITGR
jgi:hypothetical protein